MKHYVCLDLGNKRVWVAQSREGIAFPLSVVKRTELMWFLKKYFHQNPDVEHVIVGLPYDLYWVDTRQLEKTQHFIEKLKDIFPKKHIIWHDERFSSFAASDMFWDHRDDVAAQQILQSYLDMKK